MSNTIRRALVGTTAAVGLLIGGAGMASADGYPENLSGSETSLSTCQGMVSGALAQYRVWGFNTAKVVDGCSADGGRYHWTVNAGGLG